MTDTTQTPDGQASPQPAPNGSSGPEMVEKARLDGALKKIQELTEASQKQASVIAEKDAALGTVQNQLELTKQTFGTQLEETKKKVALTEAEKAELAKKAAEADALKMKMSLIAQTGNNALYDIVDAIPSASTPEEQEAIIKRFASFAGNVEAQTQKRVMAGMTGPAPVTSSQPQMPANETEWVKYVEGFPLGSPERQKAMDAWRDAAFKK